LKEELRIESIEDYLGREWFLREEIVQQLENTIFTLFSTILPHATIMENLEWDVSEDIIKLILNFISTFKLPLDLTLISNICDFFIRKVLSFQNNNPWMHIIQVKTITRDLILKKLTEKIKLQLTNRIKILFKSNTTSCNSNQLLIKLNGVGIFTKISDLFLLFPFIKKTENKNSDQNIFHFIDPEMKMIEEQKPQEDILNLLNTPNLIELFDLIEYYYRMNLYRGGNLSDNHNDFQKILKEYEEINQIFNYLLNNPQNFYPNLNHWGEKPLIYCQNVLERVSAEMILLHPIYAEVTKKIASYQALNKAENQFIDKLKQYGFFLRMHSALFKNLEISRQIDK
jgi:outer membrane protein assembly factor BamE (lipoprotein component of BamABCDE complex)